MLKLLTGSLLMLLLCEAYATEVFVWQTADGKKSYSDRNHAGARKLTVKPGYSYYSVSKVFDGDTISLQNGRIVRLLGINTPEVEGRNKKAEPGGDAAKKWLSAFLSGKRVRLRMDLEKKDKYNRTLAYVFTEDRQHLNEELVKRGLAFVNIYPPSLDYADQLLNAQQLAETKKLGIWAMKAYRPQPIDHLDRHNYKGWKRLIGSVRSLRHNRKYSYLEFSPTTDARIKNDNLQLFPELSQYLGKTLEIRGWPSRKKRHYSILIRHPSAIKIVK